MARIVLRQDTAVNWAASLQILARGEPALDLTNGQLRVGDGVSLWPALPLFDPLSGAPRVLAKGGNWNVQIEAATTDGVVTLRAVGPGPVTKLLTWNPTTNAVTADGKPLATQEWALARLSDALVVGPTLLV